MLNIRSLIWEKGQEIKNQWATGERFLRDRICCLDALVQKGLLKWGNLCFQTPKLSLFWLIPLHRVLLSHASLQLHLLYWSAVSSRFSDTKSRSAPSLTPTISRTANASDFLAPVSRSEVCLCFPCGSCGAYPLYAPTPACNLRDCFSFWWRFYHVFEYRRNLSRGCMQNTGVPGRLAFSRCTKLWACPLHDSAAWEASVVRQTREPGKSMRHQLLGARKRVRNCRQKNVTFQRVICIAKVQFKIKQKLCERQSPRQGWHSFSCHRGCCTDSCHFSVWVVFLSHRMEPLSAVAIPRGRTKGSVGVRATKKQCSEERGFAGEGCVKHLLHAAAEESVLQGKFLVSCGVMYFSTFCHLTWTDVADIGFSKKNIIWSLVGMLTMFERVHENDYFGLSAYTFGAAVRFNVAVFKSQLW